MLEKSGQNAGQSSKLKILQTNTHGSTVKIIVWDVRPAELQNWLQVT